MNPPLIVPTLLRLFTWGAGALACAAALGADAPNAAPTKEPTTNYLLRACVVESPKGTLPAGTPDDKIPAAVWSLKETNQAWSQLRSIDGVSFSPCRTCYFGSSPTGRFFAGTNSIGREIVSSRDAVPVKKFVGFWFRTAVRPVGVATDVDLSIEKVTLREDVAGAEGAPVVDAKKSEVSASVGERATIVVALGPAPQAGRELHGIIELVKTGVTDPADGRRTASAADIPESALQSLMPQFENPIAEGPMQTAALVRAGLLILPKLELRDASVMEAVTQLRALSVRCDALETGVEVRLRPNTRTDGRITCSLTHLPVSEVVRYIAKVAGLEVQAEPDALVLQTPVNSLPPP